MSPLIKALSTRNVVQIVPCENSALRKGIILQQLPRNDFSHLANLTVFYNTTLQQLVAASPFHRQLAVVGHPALALTTEAKTTALFGHPSSPRSVEGRQNKRSCNGGQNNH